MLVSGVQQSDPVIYIYMHLFFFKFFSHVGYYRIRAEFPVLYSRSPAIPVHTGFEPTLRFEEGQGFSLLIQLLLPPPPSASALICLLQWSKITRFWLLDMLQNSSRWPTYRNGHLPPYPIPVLWQEVSYSLAWPWNKLSLCQVKTTGPSGIPYQDWSRPAFGGPRGKNT